MAYNPNYTGNSGAPHGYGPGYSSGAQPQNSSAPYNYGAPGYGSGYPPSGVQSAGAPGQWPPPGAPGGMHGGAQGYQMGPPPGVSQELWNWFQAVDSDRNGRITVDELQKALMNGNWSPFNPETCRLMVGMFDIDRNGTIDIKEFSALWKYIQDWKACFDRFDTDRSGNIDANELQNAFRTFGYNLSTNFTNLCIQLFDRRLKRCINFDDFIQCCVMVKTLTDKFKEKDSKQAGMITIYYEEFLRMALDNTVV